MVHWSKTELIAFVDEYLKRLGRICGVFIARSTAFTIVAGTATYSLPTRHISTIRATWVGASLTPSSTDELELLDSDYLTTQGTPLYWYQDKIGIGKIGLYPVPNAAMALLVTPLAVLYHEYPADVDAAEVNMVLPMPTPVMEVVQAKMLAEAFGKESDGAIPEVAQHLTKRLDMMEQLLTEYYGASR